MRIYLAVVRGRRGTKRLNPEYATPEYVAAAYKLIGAVAFVAEAKLKAEALGALRRLTDELPPALPIFLQNPIGEATGRTDGPSGSAKRQKKAVS